MTNPKDLNIKIAINENCPWSGKPIDEGSLTTYKGQVVGFCNTGCRDKFVKAVDLFDDFATRTLATIFRASHSAPRAAYNSCYLIGHP